MQICEAGSPSPGSQQRLLADLSPPGRGEGAERVAELDCFASLAMTRAATPPHPTLSPQAGRGSAPRTP